MVNTEAACKLIREEETRPPSGIMNENWDNLIILDACRFDFFQEENSIQGELHTKISGGSQSWEFMNHYFISETYHDTVYVTANPHAVRIPDGVFHSIENRLNDWDMSYEVVLPQAMVDAAIDAHNRYPNKRLIVHFMQPHTPWLGQTAEWIRNNFDVKGNNKNHGKNLLGKDVDDPRSGSEGFFTLPKEGKISLAAVRQSYRETLNIVLDSVSSLIDQIEGRSVITSDHGEMLGERAGTRRVYGHPPNLWTEEVRVIPWLEIPGTERGTVAEEPLEREDVDQEVVQRQLDALGYT